jgi:hypothetical protein
LIATWSLNASNIKDAILNICKRRERNALGLASLKGTQLVINALGKLLALLLGLLHLMCWNLLLVDPGLLLGHCYWKLLLRSYMMHMYV